jgi:Na+/H+-dicarboxylate symporter/ABC-type amino acid transport substrate-binding protein
MTLSSKIFVGLFIGILTGLFLGEVAAPLKTLGDVFIKLLQVTVLPYIMVSLIAGIGRMDMAGARRLAARGAMVLLVIWGLALMLIFAASLAFPNLETASFFGSPQHHDTVAVDLLELYLPANVFYSLANNLVPAVVLFSILVGVALISVEDKAHILSLFDSMATALANINSAIVQLTPYGIFAIAASAAGTMTIEQLGLVQVYLVTYIALALVTTFWVFPALVSTLSGIPYRTVLSTFRDALVTAFATGNQFVVLPQIAENCKTLLAGRTADDGNSAAAVDVLVPVSFNFPSLGKLLVLLYVLFAAWFTNTDLNVADQLGLAFNGLFSLFGSINVAVPYLLDSLRIPTDMFQLFLVTGIVVGRFGAMLAALHIIVLTVLGTLALSGGLQLRLRALLRYVVFSALGMFALVLCLQGYFRLFVPEPPAREQVLREIQLMEPRVAAELVEEAAVLPTGSLAGRRLDHILDSGLLEVGYRAKNLPCSFLTERGELVGFDVEMAHILAQDLGVQLRFVPFDFVNLEQQLASGTIDIAMSCIASLPDRYRLASFSQSYLDLNLAFIVKDYQRAEFSSLERIREKESLAIALVSSHYFEPRLKQLLPEAKIVVLESAEQFFSGAAGEVDALLLSAEEGAAYSYRYPHYAVVTAKSGGVRLPAAYALPRGDLEAAAFVSNWIDLKRKDGTIDALYEYWMLGGAAQVREPRWSIVRDVLHLID